MGKRANLVVQTYMAGHICWEKVVLESLLPKPEPCIHNGAGNSPLELVKLVGEYEPQVTEV